MSEHSGAARAAIPPPFSAFLEELQKHEGKRAELDINFRAPEPQIVAGLIAEAMLPRTMAEEARALALRLVEGLRARPVGGFVQGLMRSNEIFQ